MTNGDLLRSLFRSFAEKDDASFRNAAEKLIREERMKNHRILAADLEKILYSKNGTAKTKLESNAAVQNVPKDRDRGFPLADVGVYDYPWERIVLREADLQTLKQVAEEHHRQDVLAAYGLKPKQRIMFYGPPGVGKTLAAKIMASALDAPLVTVRFDAIISSFLGETAANLRRVFEYAASRRCVVFFDEFDAIAKDRDNPNEHGELKRVVNTVLQLIDHYETENLFIAATNHESLLDTATWRRFEATVPFSLPTQQERVLLLRQFLRGFPHTKLNLMSISKRLSGATGADIEQIVVEALRRAVLDGRVEADMNDVSGALKLYRYRTKQIAQ